MLIDWITARLPADLLTEGQYRQLAGATDRIIRVSAATGEVKYETAAWESIRSDSHAISVRMGSDALWMQGSPARVIGSGDAVFGEGAAAALDIAGCIDAMRKHLTRSLAVFLPGPEHWKVSRVDVTENLLLESLDRVREALGVLRDCQGGRYRVSQTAGDSVYWSQTSRMKKGKAYAKGPHLKHLSRKNEQYAAIPDNHLQAADRLLRLELTLAAHWWRKNTSKTWAEITAERLRLEWQSYFEKMVGDADMKNDDELLQACIRAANTEGQGRSAFALWMLIQSQGWEKARSITSKPTWYRNLRTLHRAGLGDADISRGVIVPIRRKIFTLTVVNNWRELLAA